MAVSAIIKILQFDSDASDTDVKGPTPPAPSSDSKVREFEGSAEGEYNQTHLSAVSNPTPRDGVTGWATGDKGDWSDSPSNQPLLFYRYRFGFGRDEAELFALPGIPPLSPGAEGARWGTLDDYSGVLLYERNFSTSSDGRVHEFTTEDSGRVLDIVTSTSFHMEHMREFKGPSGEADIEQFPFLLIAVPEPFSEKNSINTDVFIRLGNYANPLVSGTITLYLDDVLQDDLLVEEFFSGLGGFNATWSNDFLFEYDARVDVKWTFSDTDANLFVIRYPFYTVEDLAGPRISNLIPVDEAVVVPVAGPIQFDVEDFESDVDLTSLVLYVNNIRIVDGENGTIGTTRFENERGYTIVFTPEEPWLYGDLIPVAIFIKDTSVHENETFYTYSFTTIESTAPRLLNLEPASCTVGVPTEADIQVDVVDGGHGLDTDTIVFTVEEIERGSVIQLIPIVHRDD